MLNKTDAKRDKALPAHTQLMRTITIRSDKTIPDNLDLVDRWMVSVLNITIEPIVSTAAKEDSKDQERIAAFIWRVLLLSRTLLQSIRIPVFDPGEIFEIDDTHTDYNVTKVMIVHIESMPKKIMTTSIDAASKIIFRLMDKSITSENIQILFRLIEKDFIAPMYSISKSGKSTMPILAEAYRSRIPFRHLGSGVYQLGCGSRGRRIDKSSVEYDSLIGAQIAQNKMSAASLIRDAGLPAPVHLLADSKEKALSSAMKLGWPIVVKPADMDRGEGVTVDIVDETMLLDGFAKAYDASRSKKVIVEKQVDGVCCRIFIAQDKMLYALNRLPKSVTGNGVDTVESLIDKANELEMSIPPWKRSEPFPKDALALEAIRMAGLTPESVPKPDELVPLRRIESTQWGGYDEDVSDTIHPDNIDLALRAARLFGLHVAGIDIISPDVTIPWYRNGAIVNEVNASPQYGGGEISRRTIPAFLHDLIEGDGRIPITVVVGDTEEMERALDIQKEQLDKGMRSFVSSHIKSMDWRGEEVHFSFEGLYRRTRSLLMDERVDALVLVMQTDEFLYTGLPLSYIDNIVITPQPVYSVKHASDQIPDNTYRRLRTLLNSLILVQ